MFIVQFAIKSDFVKYDSILLFLRQFAHFDLK